MKKSLTTNRETDEVLFLDANVLFSAAYREKSGLLRLWNLKEVRLITSAYAFDEARRNLKDEEAKARVDELGRSITVIKEFPQQGRLPAEVILPLKDRPILTAAIEAKATHLITGDFRDFGRYYGQMIGGVKILPPADFLRGKK